MQTNDAICLPVPPIFINNYVAAVLMNHTKVLRNLHTDTELFWENCNTVIPLISPIQKLPKFEELFVGL